MTMPHFLDINKITPEALRHMNARDDHVFALERLVLASDHG